MSSEKASPNCIKLLAHIKQQCPLFALTQETGFFETSRHSMLTLALSDIPRKHDCIDNTKRSPTRCLPPLTTLLNPSRW